MALSVESFEPSEPEKSEEPEQNTPEPKTYPDGYDQAKVQAALDELSAGNASFKNLIGYGAELGNASPINRAIAEKGKQFADRGEGQSVHDYLTSLPEEYRVNDWDNFLVDFAWGLQLNENDEKAAMAYAYRMRNRKHN